MVLIRSYWIIGYEEIGLPYEDQKVHEFETRKLALQEIQELGFPHKAKPLKIFVFRSESHDD